MRSLVIFTLALITASPLQAQSLNLDSEWFFDGLGSRGGAVICRLLRDGGIAQWLSAPNTKTAACQLRLDP
ncbi:hypothetical protein [Parasynechococcus marenigrum]|uniref:hypothetical protein n=1 Tax=Parasynechococcus marenigrum TaxID=2881428 RepID=UPI0011D1D340|nr:hypothetical protein [Parasynechococcus marenigrum]